MRFSSFVTGFAAVLSTIACVSAADLTTDPAAESAAESTGLEKRALAKVYKSCTKAKQVAITFDDGPYLWGNDLITNLTKYNAKATFFVNGNNWRCIYGDDQISQMRALYKAGHEFGSHTWSHKNLTELDWNKLHSEMWKSEFVELSVTGAYFFAAEEALIRILGVNPALMRPPFGAYNNLVLSAVAARNQSAVLWDFDSEDTLGRNATAIKADYKAVVTKKLNNVLALNHEVVNSTVHDVIPYALETLSKAGYKFVTVSECLGIKPYQYTKAQGKKDTTWKC
ncbi:carbohydrate esterase family 4 protein [Auriculariales sp. MPI-PUGE-AT-0066]|nr:carbohydrate esterase family 4 protein [Auriculariales sp. MPI-PUGE-AT-0066]